MPEVLERHAGIIEVTRLAGLRMVALKTDLADPGLPAALGGPVPGVRQSAGGVLWMAPDELLVTDGPAADVLAAALAGGHSTVVDVSDLRAVFGLRGPGVRDVLARLCPVDFAQFPPGTLRRTRAAQVAALVWHVAPDDWRVMTMRSVSDYAWALLTNAARPGPALGLYRP
jgi:sarcosine oxidase, subunit gamma